LDGDIDRKMFVSILDIILNIILNIITHIILYNNIVRSNIMFGIIHKIEKYGSLLLMFAMWRFFFTSLQC
jgi:hypothetical protein